VNLFGRSIADTSPATASGGNKGTGELGEELAANFLIARGFRILERNFRCKGGEVDIIARDPGDKV
jgi:putative endonuclease